MRNPTFRAMIMGLGLFGMITAGSARAGTILLARESTIRASGKAGAADFNLTDGSQDFNGFADAVDTADAGVVDGPHVSANQHSRPSMDDTDGFTGAYAEGSVTAALQAAPSDTAQAVSNFDLTFEVLGVPSVVDFGGAVGVTGNGTTTVELSNETTGEILLSTETVSGDGEGQSIQHSTVLQPGVYALSVEALVNGEPDESMAYYTVSLSISAMAGGDGGGVTPIPLPPALWSAAGLMLVTGAAGGYGKLRRERAARPA
jgi:hypothetical protein